MFGNEDRKEMFLIRDDLSERYWMVVEAELNERNEGRQRVRDVDGVDSGMERVFIIKGKLCLVKLTISLFYIYYEELLLFKQGYSVI